LNLSGSTSSTPLVNLTNTNTDNSVLKIQHGPDPSGMSFGGNKPGLFIDQAISAPGIVTLSKSSVAMVGINQTSNVYALVVENRSNLLPLAAQFRGSVDILKNASNLGGSLNVADALKVGGTFELTPGAANGRTLQSNGNGVATWSDATAVTRYFGSNIEPNTTHTKVTGYSTAFSSGPADIFNNNSGEFVAPSAGFYLVMVQLTARTTTTAANVLNPRIETSNGKLCSALFPFSANSQGVSHTSAFYFPLSLAAGERVWLTLSNMQIGENILVNNGSGTFFSVMRIR
jgi:hypothetical protein